MHTKTLKLTPQHVFHSKWKYIWEKNGNYNLWWGVTSIAYYDGINIGALLSLEISNALRAELTRSLSDVFYIIRLFVFKVNETLHLRLATVINPWALRFGCGSTSRTLLHRLCLLVNLTNFTTLTQKFILRWHKPPKLPINLLSRRRTPHQAQEKCYSFFYFYFIPIRVTCIDFVEGTRLKLVYGIWIWICENW